MGECHSKHVTQHNCYRVIETKKTFKARREIVRAFFIAMHEKLLAAAVLPMPCRILGLDMMPYSLGCEMQLWREDSPFLVLTFDEFNALPFEKQHYAVNRAVNICCRKAPHWFKLWAWMYLPHNPVELEIAVADFRNYIADGRLQFRSDLPPDNDAPVRYLGEPEILRLYRFVNFTVPRAEIELHGQPRWHFPMAWDKRDVTAWDFPYSFAKMLSQGHSESNGNLVIYNAHGAAAYTHHKQCEMGREAWTAAGVSNAKRAAALAAHPIIRELAGLEKEVEEFENSMKGDASCPA